MECVDFNVVRNKHFVVSSFENMDAQNIIGFMKETHFFISNFNFYHQACAQRRHAGIIFTQKSKKWVFRPAGATHCPDKREIWHGPRQISRLSGRNVGIQPPKLSKFWILAINLYLRSDSLALFLRNSQRLYASVALSFLFGRFLGTNNQLVISIIPRWGLFPTNFQ